MPLENDLKPTQTIQLKELLQFSDGRLKLKKGAYLFQEGTEAKGVYIILSGKVQISKITPDGRELSLRICGKNDICGELTIFTYSPTYLLTAKVIEDGEAAIIYKDKLEKELLQNSSLAFEFMKWMSDHFRRTQTKFRDLVLHGKRGALFLPSSA